jgi:hypothetical protein
MIAFEAVADDGNHECVPSKHVVKTGEQACVCGYLTLARPFPWGPPPGLWTVHTKPT